MGMENILKEIESTKKIMNSLFNCMNDKYLSKEDRKNYYSQYIEISTYYIQLNSMKSKPFTIIN